MKESKREKHSRQNEDQVQRLNRFDIFKDECKDHYSWNIKIEDNVGEVGRSQVKECFPHHDR